MLRILAALTPLALMSQTAFAGAIIPPVAVPEPISLSIFAVGVGGTLIYRRFRK